MDKITISAKSYDEAVNEAILKLGTTSDNMIIEVVSEGRSGFLGLFSKPWVINVTKKIDAKENPEKELKKTVNKEVREAKKEVKKAEPEKKIEKSHEKAVEKKVNEKDEKPVEVSKDLENIKDTVKDFLTKVLGSMGLKVDYEFNFDEVDKSLNILMVSEEDMGIIIGKRGQTLDSIQYLVGLVVNKNTDDYIRIKLDTENYRERRKEKLYSLAKSIASKVKKTRKAVTLEPMNPYERRIIHSALQNDNFVTTKSEGDEPFRYIVVLPKGNFYRRNNRRFSENKKNSQID